MKMPMIDFSKLFSRAHLAQTALLISAVLLVVLGWWANPIHAQEGYTLGPEDEIEIRVWDNDDLTRTVRVGLDGRISYPFVGELKAQGLTIMQLQKELEKRLGDGYIIEPRVSVKLTEYKSQKYFVMGNVQKPGTYPLTKDITVVEAISSAGGLLAGGKETSSTTGGIAIIVRARPGEKLDQPQMPEKTSQREQVKVSLGAALGGDSRHNVLIRNGDTIYVPGLIFYATGEVKKPGRYPYEDGMTVLMAVTTAGGFTDKASHRRTHILRHRNNTKEQIKIDLNDPIRPGDTIVVPESWF
jgi:polysaccharide export outer membrane protein